MIFFCTQGQKYLIFCYDDSIGSDIKLENNM